MEVKEFNSAQKFLENYETVLLEREAVSQLILYNAYQQRNSGMEGVGMFGAVTENDQAVLLFCNILSFNLVVYVAEQDKVLLASIALANHITSNRVVINGITARYDVCQSFMEQYRKMISGTFTEKLGMDIMEIRKVNEINPVEGRQRPGNRGRYKIDC